MLLSGIGRVLGLHLVARLSADLPPRVARRVLLVFVAIGNLAPVTAVLSGRISYGDVWLWLAVEVLTIYVWTLVRSLSARRAVPADRRWSMAPGSGGAFATVFFAFHYGAFAIVPFVVGIATVLPASPLRSPVLTVVVLGGIGFLAAGWAQAGAVLDHVPPSIGDYVRAYLRMALAYAALFLPLVGRSGDGDVGRIDAGLATTLAVGVLLAKLVLELAVVGAVERREDGRTYLFGRPVVVSVRRSA